jgi:Zn-dependent peptidase ImmA (M78 family)
MLFICDLEIARAIALYDDKTPIIGINEEDRPPAKTFSIVHELTHLLNGSHRFAMKCSMPSLLIRRSV